LVADKALWRDYYQQVQAGMQGEAFIFQLQGPDEAKLVAGVSHLPFSVDELRGNNDNISIINKRGHFCQLIGPPDKIVSLFNEAS